MDNTSTHRDWRSEPRKSVNELYSCPVYVRMTQRQRDAVRQMARERGESDARFLRCLVDREARIQLKGETDAKLAPTPRQSAVALAVLKGLGRQRRRRSD